MSNIETRYRWDTADIFEGEAAWEAAFAEVKTAADSRLPALKGAFSKGAASMLEAFGIIDDAKRTLSKVYCYAQLNRDENTREAKWQGYVDRATSLYTELMTALSFVSPEIQALGSDAVDAYLASEPGLAVYRRTLDDILRMAPHTLPEEGETLLSMSADALAGAETAYSILTGADLRFPTVTTEDGERVEVTQGNLIPLLESGNRRVRRETFNAFYDTIKQYEATFGALYSANVKAHIFESKARRYTSPREASLFTNEVPEAVYDSLIEAVHAQMPLMHRYVDLRRRSLGLDKIHFWDLYTPMTRDYSMNLPYDQAYDMVTEALAPLGEDYAALLKLARDGRWIDVYEVPGKRSGGYMQDVYGVHPYILLNYHDTLDNASTLAHELGHAMHSHLSDAKQPYPNHDYPIFLAEIASNINEALLHHYLVGKLTDRDALMYLLGDRMQAVRGSVYRQTMFAEFEHISHQMALEGKPLTGEALTALYMDLNRLYYGPGMEMDAGIAYEWMRIPHFYMNFYVFQYSTGFAAANAMADNLLNGGAAERTRTLEFLSSGNAAAPLETLKRAGVDMTTPAPVKLALEGFGKTLDAYEALLG